MRVCTVEGCGRKHKGHGYCDTHWQRWRKTGSVESARPVLKSRTALAELPPDQLALYWRWVDLRRGRGGGLVPEWENDFDAFLGAVGVRPSPEHRLYTKYRGELLGPKNFQWRAGVRLSRQKGEDRLAFRRRYNEERKRRIGTVQLDGQLRKKYGIGLEEFRAMHTQQEGKCAICGQEEAARGRHGAVKTLAVDHDHLTGHARALLCQACNQMLGNCRDDRRVLLAAVAYLDKHAANA